MTPEAINQLKQTFPKCRIEWDGGVIEPMAALAPFSDADVEQIAAD